jgi:hypothetical protein
VLEHPATPSTTVNQELTIMANESVPENPHPDLRRTYEMAVLHLAHAIALTRMIGAAVEYCPSDGLPAEDATSGVIYLLEEAGELFRNLHAPAPT